MPVQYEEILKVITTYIIPILSFFFSAIALFQSRKSRKVEEKLKSLELYIKEHQAKKIEDKQNTPNRPNIEAKVYKVSKESYKAKIWNSGNATAYNITASIPEKYSVLLMKNKFPFEYLKPNQSFEEHVIYHMGSSPKFEIETNWEDANGKKYSNTELRSI
ncbi:hypothetical protein [Facklamia miroungae]|uniref:Uncharacterized protein n=1 Tax=Facklamia miroungae TaxID=120956 RepID=A0A1G7RF40_9LACT|nr:hypothetical protein [Facklamia miroungae]NKZ29440.1 hypothetical protein [Facklamia miroungae]SDG09265.1 hypothetical protein SAMN05421791_10315 [Facklamia miroungae]